MEAPLLAAFDKIVKQRASTRSEVLRDLARSEVTKAEVERGGDAVAALTLVYDHHVRDLTERLTDLQHTLGDRVRSTMHVHLDRSHCLEVIILQGPAVELRAFADRVFATRGVKHGGIEIIATSERRRGGLHVHVHAHDGDELGHEHEHGAGHDHDHDHDHAHDAEHGARERGRRPAPAATTTATNKGAKGAKERSERTSRRVPSRRTTR